MEYVAWTPSPIFVRRIIYGCVEALVGSDQRLHVGEEEVITPSRLAPVVANDLMMKGAIPGYGHKGDQQSKGAKGSGNPGEKGSE